MGLHAAGMVTPWEGLSRSLRRRRTDLQCTDRLTQRRYQVNTTGCCTGKNTPPLLFPRSGNEWWVGEKGYRAGALQASVGGEPDQPPSTGWKFINLNTKEHEADDTLSCRVYVSTSPCCLTVSLSGAAKEAQGQCEGEYKSTGLVSAGKPVMII